MTTHTPLGTILQSLKSHFNLMPDKEDEQDTYAAIRSGVDFRGANLWILIFAIFMASLGLNVNSTAVIIGAMLISPLMGPIIGMGFAVGVNDFSLFKRALKNYLVATLISVATFLGVRLMKFRKKVFVDPARERRVRHSLIAIVAITMIPAAFMTYHILRQELVSSAVSRFVRTELTTPGTQIISRELLERQGILRVVAVGRPISRAAISRAEQRLPEYNLENVRLQVIQGAQTDSLATHSIRLSAENSTRLIQEQAARIHDLEAQLAQNDRFAALGLELRPQLGILFPEVQSVALGEVAQAVPDSAQTSLRYAVAVVQLRERLSPERRTTLRLWLKEQLQTDSLRLLVP